MGSKVKLVPLFAASSLGGVLLMGVELASGVWWPSGVAITVIFFKDISRPFMTYLNDMHGSRAQQTGLPFGLQAMPYDSSVSGLD